VLLFCACGPKVSLVDGDGGLRRDSELSSEPLATAMVGPEGGGLVMAGLALGIPAGALDEVTEISVYRAAAPEGFDEIAGDVLRFEPAGLTFAEPLLINVEAPADFAGRLWWSTEDGEGFEPIGYVEWGRARAYVEHFSTLVMSGMGCEDTVIDDNQLCDCIHGSLGEGIGALCQTNPLMGMVECNTDIADRCPDHRTWVGHDGANCSGYGRLPNQAIVCSCTGTSGDARDHALCPQEFDLSGGMQICPCGISDFVGSPGGSCSGHYVYVNPDDLSRESRSASGRYTNCSADYVVIADPAENWPGTMMNCVPQGGPTMPDYPSGDPMGTTIPMGYPPMMQAPAEMPSVSCGG
jgi:hypothetical protein